MNGIKHERTSPYSPWQNGIAERYNRTVLNLVRAMLDGKSLQKKLWEYAADQAVYVINRVPGGHGIPLTIFRGEIPDFGDVLEFGLYRTLGML
jgi:hypothetical protein